MYANIFMSMFALRADDCLSFQFFFGNLQVSTPSSGNPVLTVTDPTQPAFIGILFQPQHIAEATFTSTSISGLSATARTALNGVFAYNSSLVFEISVPKPSMPPIPPIALNLQSLLEKCSELPLSIAQNAYAGLFRIGTLQFPTGISTAGRLTDLIVQHRAVLQAGRSLTFKFVGGRVVAGATSSLASSAASSSSTATGAGPTPSPPSFTETQIQIPWGLVISPNQFGAWSHALAPQTSSVTGRTELWHTRLVSNAQPIPKITAIFSDIAPSNFFFSLGGQEPSFTTSLDRGQRAALVTQSVGNSDIVANNLMLTSLGGWLDARGTWPPPSEIQEWRHVATMARDHYVHVETPGYLLPFGHKALFTQTTERMFFLSLPGNPALLITTYRIMVLDQDKFYLPNSTTDKSLLPFALQMPFQRVRITTKGVGIMPPPPSIDPSSGQVSFGSFCPQVNGVDFNFHLIAEDLDGNEIEYSAPLIFVDQNGDNSLAAGDKSIISMYGPGQGRDTWDLQGRRVPFADSTDLTNTGQIKPGSTSFETGEITFSAKPLTDAQVNNFNLNLLGQGGWQCHFYPNVTSAQVVVPAVKHLAPGNSGSITVYYYPTYLTSGFDPGANKGQVFLTRTNPNPSSPNEPNPPPDPNAAITFSGHADRSGALATPDMQITGLSRALGPVSGSPDKISTGNFDPADFFNATLSSVKLFGVIPLTEVLTAAGIDPTQDLGKVPRFISDAITKFEALVQDVSAVQQLVNNVSSAIPNDASQLGSAAATLTNDVNAINPTLGKLQADLQDIGASLSNFIANPTQAARDQLTGPEPGHPGVNGFLTDLTTFVSELQTLVNDLPALNDFADSKRQLQQILSRFSQEIDTAGTTLDAITELLVDALNAQQLTVKFEWSPGIQPIGIDLKPLPAPPDKSAALFWPNQPSNGFVISIEAQVSKTGAEPAMDIYCGLRDFALQLVPGLGPFLTVNFDSMEFTVSTGNSPDVNVKLSQPPIQFGGCLNFINTLEQWISAAGFSDPPALSVTAEGITASYSLGLPSIGIGVFSLQNISLGAGLNLPFVATTPLEVDFNFCSREQPFLLSVSLFAGGGYLLLTATPSGVAVEAALEFGASISVDLGVASGGVSVMAGVMFAMDGSQVTLDGFLKMGGYVSVLGIVSMSIELDLELTYVSPNSVAGEATITVEVSVIGFSEAVQISCQKQFAGPPSSEGAQAMIVVHTAALAADSGGAPRIPAPAPPPPTFKDLMQPEGTQFPWRDYCRAFA